MGVARLGSTNSNRKIANQHNNLCLSQMAGRVQKKITDYNRDSLNGN